MNRKDIENMPCNELDILIAKHVFGMAYSVSGLINIYENEEYLWRDWEVPHFSDDISDAWMVVEKMQELGHGRYIVCRAYGLDEKEEGHNALFSGWRGRRAPENHRAHARQTSLPLQAQ